MRNFDPITLSGEIESPSVITYYEGITLTDALRRAKFKSKIDELRVDIFTPYEWIKSTDEQYSENSQNSKSTTDELMRDTSTSKEGIKSADKLYSQKFKSAADELMRDTSTSKEGIRSTNVVGSQRSVDELGSQRFKSKTDELRGDIYASEKQLTSIYLQDLLIKGNKELDIELAPGTQLIVKKTFEFEKDRVVKILGEVANPGTYKLTQGMTLYDLIVQAGGYTEYAYPKAMVFIRESARRQQYEQLQLTLITMEEAIAKNSEAYGGVGGSAQEKALLDITLNKQKRSFELLKRKAEMGLGRIALEIPETLEELKDSEQNIELVDGDSIYIPLRPSYVLVLGSVYNQISLPYKKDYRLKDYLEDVGGLSKNADDSDLYVIKANGKIVSQRNFSSKYLGWEKGKFYFRRDFMAMNLEQGDTIVIPEEIKVPILWMPLIRDVTSILFQAIATVGIIANL
jgi:protein involved in polysaccharide export with SLBB domain